MDNGKPCPIGGWFERFGDRADLWLWHAPDWFWLRDGGMWPSGFRRYGTTVPVTATLHMLWRRWVHREEVCWWGYAEDVGGYPRLRMEAMHPTRIHRTADGLLSHGSQLTVPWNVVARFEWWLHETMRHIRSIVYRWRQRRSHA